MYLEFKYVLPTSVQTAQVDMQMLLKFTYCKSGAFYKYQSRTYFELKQKMRLYLTPISYASGTCMFHMSFWKLYDVLYYQIKKIEYQKILLKSSLDLWKRSFVHAKANFRFDIKWNNCAITILNLNIESWISKLKNIVWFEIHLKSWIFFIHLRFNLRFKI